MTPEEKTALIERTDGKATHEIATADLAALATIQKSEVARNSLMRNYRERVARRPVPTETHYGLYADDFAY